MDSGVGERPSDAGAVAERLGELLGEPLDSELQRLSSGASRETFAFSTPMHGALVAQIARGGAKLVNSSPQAALLQAAADAGVPVAAVVAHGDDDDVLGTSWTVMRALPGTADPAVILADGGAPAPVVLIDQIAAALAAVHRMQLDSGSVPVIDDPLALLREWHERLGEPHPAFELAFRALEAERPPAGRRTLVHGDFRMGNLMVAPHGLTGVLDWELAHTGDPLEDLGWLCVPAWRFSRPDRPAAGLGTRAQLREAYERHADVAVEEAALRWWELAGALRWGVICVMQAFTHLSGAKRSVEHAVIGRRACEVEWDLLELLDVPHASGDALGHVQTAAPAPQLHDRPTAIELLEAARGALGDNVLPHVHGRDAFEVRVVLRALGIVRRELTQREEHDALHAAALAAVGSPGERELALAIRDGDLDRHDARVLAAVRATVRAKLETANPSYLSQSATEET